MEEIMYIIFVAYLVVINLIAFAIMGLDKNYAAKGKWRIPEKTLFLPVLLGGGIGGVLGMRVFRHKTKHWYFRWGLPALLLAQLAVLVWLWLRMIQ